MDIIKKQTILNVMDDMLTGCKYVMESCSGSRNSVLGNNRFSHNMCDEYFRSIEFTGETAKELGLRNVADVYYLFNSLTMMFSEEEENAAKEID